MVVWFLRMFPRWCNCGILVLCLVSYFGCCESESGVTGGKLYARMPFAPMVDEAVMSPIGENGVN